MRVAMHLYSFGYRHFRVPWDGGGPRVELVELVEGGRLPPGRAIYLAQQGFDVTGVDYAPGAIALGRRRAAEAGVEVNFVEDDLADLCHVTGTFDLLVDYGVLDDMAPAQRDLYTQSVVLLSHPGSRFLLFCFEWQPRWWERFHFYRMACDPGEVERRFGPDFEIERYAEGESGSRFIPGWAAYLMTRKGTNP
jgi:hypothetical protein